MQAGYVNFEMYCYGRWGFTKRHGNRLIAAASTAKALAEPSIDDAGPMGPNAINERQARELAPLAKTEPETARAIWREVVDEAELREIEIEENLRRKDLTSFEMSKTMTVKAQYTADSFPRNSVEKAPQGRKSDYGIPKSEIAQALGTSETALREAEQHVATAETYPVFQKPDWKQYHVQAHKKTPRRDAGVFADNVFARCYAASGSSRMWGGNRL